MKNMVKKKNIGNFAQGCPVLVEPEINKKKRILKNLARVFTEKSTTTQKMLFVTDPRATFWHQNRTSQMKTLMKTTTDSKTTKQCLNLISKAFWVCFSFTFHLT